MTTPDFWTRLITPEEARVLRIARVWHKHRTGSTLRLLANAVNAYLAAPEATTRGTQSTQPAEQDPDTHTDGATAQEPTRALRTWNEGDAQPADVTHVRDYGGDIWRRTGPNVWRCGEGNPCTWHYIADAYGPLTELPHEPSKITDTEQVAATIGSLASRESSADQGLLNLVGRVLSRYSEPGSDLDAWGLADRVRRDLLPALVELDRLRAPRAEDQPVTGVNKQADFMPDSMPAQVSVYDLNRAINDAVSIAVNAFEAAVKALPGWIVAYTTPAAPASANTALSGWDRGDWAWYRAITHASPRCACGINDAGVRYIDQSANPATTDHPRAGRHHRGRPPPPDRSAVTTEPAHPTTTAHAAAVLIVTTGTLGSIITIVLAFTPLPWWLAIAPLWAPVAALYVAITWAAAAAFARALVQPRDRT